MSASAAAVSLLRLPQVAELVGLKKTAIYKQVRAGTFPRPVKLGGASAWRLDEVQNYILRISEARGPASDGVGLTPNASLSGGRRPSA